MNVVKEDAVIINYENWRQHPITTELVKNLEKLKKEFYKELTSNSLQVHKVSDQELRHKAVCMYQIETCIELCTNYNAFRILLNK